MNNINCNCEFSGFELPPEVSENFFNFSDDENKKSLRAVCRALFCVSNTAEIERIAKSERNIKVYSRELEANDKAFTIQNKTQFVIQAIVTFNKIGRCTTRQDQFSITLQPGQIFERCFGEPDLSSSSIYVPSIEECNYQLKDIKSISNVAAGYTEKDISSSPRSPILENKEIAIGKKEIKFA